MGQGMKSFVVARQAGWHGGNGRVLNFSQGIAPQHPVLNWEHHYKGCPSHLLTGHAQPGLQMAGL